MGEERLLGGIEVRGRDSRAIETEPLHAALSAGAPVAMEADHGDQRCLVPHGILAITKGAARPGRPSRFERPCDLLQDVQGRYRGQGEHSPPPASAGDARSVAPRSIALLA